MDSRPASVLEHHPLGVAEGQNTNQGGGSLVPGGVASSAVSNQVSRVGHQVSCDSVSRVSFTPKLDISLASQLILANNASDINPGVTPSMTGHQPGDICTHPKSAPIHTTQTQYHSSYTTHDVRRGSLPVSHFYPHHHHPNLFLLQAAVTTNNKIVNLNTSLENITTVGQINVGDTTTNNVPLTLSKYTPKGRLAFPNQITRRRSADPVEIYRAKQGMRLAVAERSGSASPNRNTSCAPARGDHSGSNEDLLSSYLETRRASGGSSTLLSPVLETLLPGLQDLAMSTIKEMGSQSSLQVCKDDARHVSYLLSTPIFLNKISAILCFS